MIVLGNGHLDGSGFFVTPEGLLITAAHMVRDKPKALEIASPHIGRIKARRVAMDLGHDLALLQAAPRPKPYPVLPVASRQPGAGEKVFLFGTPEFRHRVLLTGFVARGETTYCYSTGTSCYVRAFFIAGTSPRGTSGGCWLNEAGEVVGVQGGYINSGKNPAGIAFASPRDAVWALLVGRTSTAVPTLGTRLDELWTQSPAFIRRFPAGTAGVLTVSPNKTGPVASAKLTKESLILAVDGAPVTYKDEVLDRVRAKKPGQSVTLRVLDPDKKSPRDVAVRLGQVPDSPMP